MSEATTKSSLFAPTFSVELPSQAADPNRPKFTFRKATVLEILGIEDAVTQIQNSQADHAGIIRALKGYVEDMLVDDAAAEILQLTFEQFVELFWLMKNGQDVSLDEKKESGSPSPSDTEICDPTNSQ